MYIHKVAHYIPSQVVANDYFFAINGLSDEWIIERTGIRERRKASSEENTHSMGLNAALALSECLDFSPAEIDLIIGATYTPYDTIVTLGHHIQKALDLPDVPVFTISAACSSLVNAMEIAMGFFSMGRSRRALVVASEHNSGFNNEFDKKSGHLWGDGAVALLLSTERLSEQDLEVIDITTGGAAHVGKAMEGVRLRASEGRIDLPNGRDVFIHACEFMGSVTRKILEKNGYSIAEMAYFIPHQANLRITKRIAADYQIPSEKILSNIQYLGNTGAAGCGIALSENWSLFEPGQLVALSVFGGGYSYGAALLRR